MSRFLTPLRVEQLNPDDWQLLSPLHYDSDLLGRVVQVPTGFITDFASVPRLPFIYWATGGAAEAPAVIHDWFYRTGTEEVSRAMADSVLAEAINSREHYWRIRSWMMWAGVRVGGYWSYETRSIHSTEPIIKPQGV